MKIRVLTFGTVCPSLLALATISIRLIEAAIIVSELD
jgi:hypothetical protein